MHDTVDFPFLRFPRWLHVIVFPFLQALYQSWVLDSCRNILAVLEDMPSLKPPIDHLCELLPRLQARYYSIASSSKVLLAGKTNSSYLLISF